MAETSTQIPLPALIGLVSLGSVAVGAGVSYGLLAGEVHRTREMILEIKSSVDAHHALPSHVVTQVQLDTISRALGELQRASAAGQDVRGELRVIRENVGALCRAVKAANCGP